jgi:hypothetical protein
MYIISPFSLWVLSVYRTDTSIMIQGNGHRFFDSACRIADFEYQVLQMNGCLDSGLI